MQEEFWSCFSEQLCSDLLRVISIVIFNSQFPLSFVDVLIPPIPTPDCDFQMHFYYHTCWFIWLFFLSILSTLIITIAFHLYAVRTTYPCKFLLDLTRMELRITIFLCHFACHNDVQPLENQILIFDRISSDNFWSSRFCDGYSCVSHFFFCYHLLSVLN